MLCQVLLGDDTLYYVSYSWFLSVTLSYINLACVLDGRWLVSFGLLQFVLVWISFKYVSGKC